MTAHLTEEEQLEQMKRWWNENGKSTVTGVLLAVAAYLGYEGWQGQQQKTAEAASAVYQNMLESVSAPVLSDEQQATASHLAGELKNNHGDSLYANYGAMMLARIAVQNNELDKAAAELRWVLDQNPQGPVADLTRSRLARVLAEKGAYTEAHKLVASTGNKNVESLYAEVRGDIYLQENNFSAARTAYDQALADLQSFEEGQRSLLQIKLQNVPQEASKTEEAPQVSSEDVASEEVVAEAAISSATEK